MSAVGIDISTARDTAGLLQHELDLMEGLRSGHRAIINAANDWEILGPIRTAMGEFNEDVGNTKTLLSLLADYAEAADDPNTPANVLAQLETQLDTQAARVREGLDDGVGATASDAEIDAYRNAYNDAVQRAQFEGADFDLATSIVGGRFFPDGTIWHSGVVDGGSNIDHVGGGAILGPDGQYWPIVIPLYTGPDGDIYSTALGDAGGANAGWSTVGRFDGTTQFHDGLSSGQRLLVAVAVGTGLDIPALTDDDALTGLVYREGLPPLLTQVPATYDNADSTDFGGAFEDTRHSPAGAAVDLATGAIQGVTTFNNLDQNNDRAYEVVFEQHESGARRATVTTHSVGVGGDGEVYVTASHVYVSDDNRLAQLPASYLPPENPIFTQPGIVSDGHAPIRPASEITTRPLHTGPSPIEIQTDHLGE